MRLGIMMHYFWVSKTFGQNRALGFLSLNASPD